MAFDKFLISPFKTGLQTDVKRWMVMDDAFTELQNSYVFRSRTIKRFGSQLMTTSQYTSRLRIALTGGSGVGITDGSGDATGTVPGDIFEPGQIFTIGSQVFTVQTTGTPSSMANTGSGTGTFDTTTGAYVFSGATLSTQIYFYPATPVMGITQFEMGSINDHPTFAFDQQFAYQFIPNTGWVRSGTAEWNGDDTKYFWATNWKTVLLSTVTMFVTNFNYTLGAGAPAATDDPIWYYDGTTWVSMAGTGYPAGIFFRPSPAGTRLAIAAGPFVQTCRMIFAYKNHLVLLYTIENNNSSTSGTGTATAYPNRARYCFLGNPLAVNAWYEEGQTDSSGNTYAGGGLVDASTDEQIISAEFVKDRLIVYFERSTWELAYTGNDLKPYQWNKLNTELGSQGTFSTVAFDKDILTIGNTGVHACNGSNVQRIDSMIPDEIFKDFSAMPTSTNRIQGIRDYQKEVVYWAFMTEEGVDTGTINFPDQIMLYNYRNNTWAFNDDCFTTFGYFEQDTDTTWASSVPTTWEQANFDWSAGITSANQRQIVAGNPEGFMMIINPELSRNSASLQITSLTIAATGIITIVAYNNNLAVNTIQFPADGDFLLFENIVADSTTQSYLNGTIYAVASVNSDGNTFTINTNDRVINEILIPPLTSGTYYGGGTLARVSNIMINTKQFNPYDKQDTNVFLGRVDFAVQKTGAFGVVGGQLTVDYSTNDSSVSMIQSGVETTAIMGNSILETTAYDPSLYPMETFQALLWHPVYFQAIGENVQLILAMSYDQMINPSISLSDFELEGMCLYTMKSGRMQ